MIIIKDIKTSQLAEFISSGEYGGMENIPVSESQLRT
jgi:hypothetical protein